MKKGLQRPTPIDRHKNPDIKPKTRLDESSVDDGNASDHDIDPRGSNDTLDSAQGPEGVLELTTGSVTGAAPKSESDFMLINAAGAVRAAKYPKSQDYTLVITIGGWTSETETRTDTQFLGDLDGDTSTA